MYNSFNQMQNFSNNGKHQNFVQKFDSSSIRPEINSEVRVKPKTSNVYNQNNYTPQTSQQFELSFNSIRNNTELTNEPFQQSLFLNNLELSKQRNHALSPDSRMIGSNYYLVDEEIPMPQRTLKDLDSEMLKLPHIKTSRTPHEHRM